MISSINKVEFSEIRKPIYLVLSCEKFNLTVQKYTVSESGINPHS